MPAEGPWLVLPTWPEEQSGIDPLFGSYGAATQALARAQAAYCVQGVGAAMHRR